MTTPRSRRTDPDAVAARGLAEEDEVVTTPARRRRTHITTMTTTTTRSQPAAVRRAPPPGPPVARARVPGRAPRPSVRAPTRSAASAPSAGSSTVIAELRKVVWPRPSAKLITYTTVVIVFVAFMVALLVAGMDLRSTDCCALFSIRPGDKFAAHLYQARQKIPACFRTPGPGKRGGQTLHQLDVSGR